MFIIRSYAWWYFKGWGVFIDKVKSFFAAISDFFSMNSLIRTLFKPFRQISAGTAGATASLELKFHMFIDRLVSRIIGFFSRLILLIVGCIVLVLSGFFGFILIVLWPFIPLAPIIGLFVSALGVVL